MTTELELDNPFWRFSLLVYAKTEVRDECLGLQNAHGIDVNLLLLAAWLAAERGLRITEKDAAAMQSFIETWHAAVVLPLRTVRREVKEIEFFSRPQVFEFRRHIAGVELAAEQIEQALLFEWAANRWPYDHPRSVAFIHENITAYLSMFRTGEVTAPLAPALERASQG